MAYFNNYSRYKDSRTYSQPMNRTGYGNYYSSRNVIKWDIEAMSVCKSKIEAQRTCIHDEIKNITGITNQSMTVWNSGAGELFISQLQTAKAELDTFDKDVTQAINLLKDGIKAYTECENEVIVLIKAI